MDKKKVIKSTTHIDGILVEESSTVTIFHDEEVVKPPIVLPPIVGRRRFEFAEISEQVFVSGYAESENMNLYCLDTNNLHPTGERTLPWADGNDDDDFFTPKRFVDVEGNLPIGVEWDKYLGKFIYSGLKLLDDMSNIISNVRFHEPVSNKYSEYFKVKLLKPTLIWGVDEDEYQGNLQDCIIDAVRNNDREENVILVKDGEYQGTDLNASGNGYINAMESKDNFYLIGEPGAMPIISGVRSDWATNEYPDQNDGQWGSRTILRFSNTPHVHMKNLDTRYCALNTSGCSHIFFNKVINRIYYNTSWHVTQISDTANSDVITHVTNYLTYHIGSWAQQHPIYDHSAPTNSKTPVSPFVGRTYLNNYVAYECSGPGNPSGGHIFKSISNYVTIRNSWMSLCKDPDNPDFERAGDMGVSLHAHQRAKLYNNDIFTYYDESISPSGDVHSLLFQPRALQDGLGALQPSYFSWPSIRTNDLSLDSKSGWDCWENWSGSANNASGYSAWKSSRNPEFHGTNVAPYNYSKTGERGDESMGDIAPADAPFWDTIGDVSLPSNDMAYWKFAVHCRFHTIPTPNPYHRVIAITSRTTAPTTNAGSDNKSFLPVPPNWVERTWLHGCNNSFDSGFHIPYHTDFQEPIAIRYAHGISDTASATKDNITLYGGDIINGEGENIAIPDEVRI